MSAMQKISVETKSKKEVVDITGKVSSLLRETDKKSGLANIFITHTTAAIATIDEDPGVEEDMHNAFEKMVPKLDYKHPHNPSHMPSHILSTLIGTSLTLPFENKKLILGPWQRIVLIEFDGPRTREIVVNFI